jgi:hypothetical protein
VVLVVFCCVAGLALAWRADRAGRPFPAVLLLGLTTLLATPISWNHNYVWAVPVLVWCCIVAARTRSSALWAVIAVSAVDFLLAPYTWGLPVGSAADLRLTVDQSLLAATYAANAVLLVAVLALSNVDAAAVDNSTSSSEIRFG